MTTDQRLHSCKLSWFIMFKTFPYTGPVPLFMYLLVKGGNFRQSREQLNVEPRLSLVGASRQSSRGATVVCIKLVPSCFSLFESPKGAFLYLVSTPRTTLPLTHVRISKNNNIKITIPRTMRM